MDNNILVVGSIALDSLKTIKGERNNLIGGSSTYFSISASKYALVYIVGIVGEDFPQSGWDLYSENNIDITNIQAVKGKTFSWGGKYNSDYTNRETLFTNLGVFEKFYPKINSNALKSKYIFLGNIQPELQIQVKNQVSQDSVIILDTMNLWIGNNYAALIDAISDIDIFMLNDEEAQQLTGMKAIGDAGDKLLDLGPKTIIIKQGSKGSTLFHNNDKVNIPTIPNVDVFDPTGAGDSFAGGFVGYLAKHNNSNYIDAMIHGTAIASFTVSGFGLEGLLNATNSQILQRIDLLKGVYYG